MAMMFLEAKPVTQVDARLIVRRLGIVLTLAALGAPLFAQDAATAHSQPMTRVTQATSAYPVRVLFTDLPGLASAQVPGLAAGTIFTTFDRPFGSPNGHWVLTALTNLPSTEDEVVLVDGAVGARDGTLTGVAGSANLVVSIDRRVAINDAGQWAYAIDTDAATTQDEMIIKMSGGAGSWAAEEGSPAPGIAGGTLGATLETPVITANGLVGYSADLIQNVPVGQNDALILGGVALMQSGVTVPTGQIGAETLENFDIDDFWMSADGNYWLSQGDLSGATATDGVVVFRNAVVVQEGVILPGSGFAEAVNLNGIIGTHMTANARWFVRGNNATTGVDWIYSNGNVLAKVGDLVSGVAGENWSDSEFADCFFMHIGDTNGNYVIGGVSDGPTTSNGVLVLNQSFVIARESDPIDLDGNGQFDDDAFFNTFGNDDGVLTDAGYFYVVANIKNAAGTPIGEGYFVIATPLVDPLFGNSFE